MTDLKKEEEFRWLNDVSSVSLQEALTMADADWGDVFCMLKYKAEW